MIHLTGLFLVGAVFGGVAQRTHFCTMGAIADFVLFRSTRRLRSWGLALAVAMVGTQALVAAGAIDLGGVAVPPAGWLGSILGGAAFGFGMVLAGGCFSRNLVRLAAGSLKALFVVLLAAMLAAAAWHGALSPLARALWSLSPGPLPGPPSELAPWGIALAAVLATGCLADSGFRRARREVVAGLVLGALPPFAWLMVGGPADPAAASGLNYALSTAAAAAAFVGAGPAGSAGALVLGTLAGAFLAAATAGQLRIEAFSTTDDMLRHLSGGVLMGVGGGLAGGCTIGHGLTGLGALAPASLLAVLTMAAGAAWALRWLQTGSLLGLRRGTNDA
ncbi:MAG TPA: YeeE/YedE thiosulfate transporter family protein [Geminicoccaceae bacterium]|nr:YeeE/YedE thiosulfate transporter family protein [Geminicoccus sp.]HMU51141.1 YeeE/YedE thiosulfate transporter family protein [Geminicoccaceae bacterium]